MLMQHKGSFHLDDVRDLKEDGALRTILGLKQLPSASTLGDWLRKTGKRKRVQDMWEAVNKVLLKSALHRCKAVTLDIDATEVTTNKTSASWTYKSNKGYMPMVGHLGETGQVVSCDFRNGNQPPNSENLAFIKQCKKALPDGCRFKSIRIDSAGYQEEIIKYCDEQAIRYVIRAKMCADIKDKIDELPEKDWQPMQNKKGEVMAGQDTYRTVHCIGEYEKPFTLIIQRKQIKGQIELDLDDANSEEEVEQGGYIYRAIATNREELENSEIVHWYNQRGEDSENRIKELKLDFGGDTLPCSDFKANALYFNIAALSYNLFALMRQLLPLRLSSHRVITIRWKLYATAAKVVKTGRQYFVKLRKARQKLLSEVLEALGRLEPPPI
jgi:hypothetical protein